MLFVTYCEGREWLVTKLWFIENHWIAGNAFSIRHLCLYFKMRNQNRRLRIIVQQENNNEPLGTGGTEQKKKPYWPGEESDDQTATGKKSAPAGKAKVTVNWYHCCTIRTNVGNCLFIDLWRIAKIDFHWQSLSSAGKASYLVLYGACWCCNYSGLPLIVEKVKGLDRSHSRTAVLYSLWSGSWLAWASDTAVHYAAIHCLR